MLKEKLDDWGERYETINQTDTDTRFDRYPQLHYNGKDVLENDTSGLTQAILCDRMYPEPIPAHDWNQWHQGDLFT